MKSQQEIRQGLGLPDGEYTRPMAMQLAVETTEMALRQGYSKGFAVDMVALAYAVCPAELWARITSEQKQEDQ